jgi:predicted alpha/beta hydrolase family esterase
MPLRKLPFRSVVVASTDDPFVTLERAKLFATSWGSRLIQMSNAGHINTASGHGPWPEGEAWLEEMREIG